MSSIDGFDTCDVSVTLCFRSLSSTNDLAFPPHLPLTSCLIKSAETFSETVNGSVRYRTESIKAAVFELIARFVRRVCFLVFRAVFRAFFSVFFIFFSKSNNRSLVRCLAIKSGGSRIVVDLPFAFMVTARGVDLFFSVVVVNDFIESDGCSVMLRDDADDEDCFM